MFAEHYYIEGHPVPTGAETEPFHVGDWVSVPERVGSFQINAFLYVLQWDHDFYDSYETVYGEPPDQPRPAPVGSVVAELTRPGEHNGWAPVSALSPASPYRGSRTGVDRHRPTWLYRYFDADDRLLYVGVAFDVLKRAQGHRRHAAWWPLATTYTEERYPTRTEAEAAEVEAIRTEAPLYNVVHNRKLVLA